MNTPTERRDCSFPDSNMSITLEKHLSTCFTCDAKAGERVRPEDAFESAAPISTLIGKGEKTGQHGYNRTRGSTA